MQGVRCAGGGGGEGGVFGAEGGLWVCVSTVRLMWRTGAYTRRLSCSGDGPECGGRWSGTWEVSTSLFVIRDAETSSGLSGAPTDSMVDVVMTLVGSCCVSCALLDGDGGCCAGDSKYER